MEYKIISIKKHLDLAEKNISLATKEEIIAYNKMRYFYDNLPAKNQRKILSSNELYQFFVLLLELEIQHCTKNNLFNLILEESPIKNLIPIFLLLNKNNLFTLDQFKYFYHFPREYCYFFTLVFNYFDLSNVLNEQTISKIFSVFLKFKTLSSNNYHNLSNFCNTIFLLHEKKQLNNHCLSHSLSNSSLPILVHSSANYVNHILQRAEIHDLNIINQIVNAAHAENFALAAEVLNYHSILTSENLILIHSVHVSLYLDLALMLSYFNTINLIINNEIKNKLVQHKYLEKILGLFCYLKPFITQEIVINLINSTKILYIDIAAKILFNEHSEKNILCADNFSIIQHHDDPVEAANTLLIFHQECCLTPRNQALVKQYRYPLALTKIINLLINFKKIHEQKILPLVEIAHAMRILDEPLIFSKNNAAYLLGNFKNNRYLVILELLSNSINLTDQMLAQVREKKQIDTEEKKDFELYLIDLVVLNICDLTQEKLNFILLSLKEYNTVNRLLVYFLEHYKDLTNDNKLLDEIVRDNNYYQAILLESKYFPKALLFKFINPADCLPRNTAILAKKSVLKRIEIKDGGQSKDTWSAITHALIDKAPVPPKKPLLFLVNVIQKMPMNAIDVLILDEKIAENWFFLRIQGRTIILKNQNNEIYAIKIQKDTESFDTLIKEFLSVKKFKELALSLALKSTIPAPISIKIINSVLVWLKKYVSQESLNLLIGMIGEKSYHFAYVYQVRNNDYFTYLHDPLIPEHDFSLSNRVAITDLCYLLKHDIFFPQLADLYHNLEQKERLDNGRYIVLANLLSPAAIYSVKPSGTGRLTGWECAVEYPNLRYSGLADFGDWISLADLDENSSWAKMYFSPAIAAYKGKIKNYLVAELLAEYQYILLLIAGRRGRKISDELSLNTEKKLVWQALAKQVVINCSIAISVLTHQVETQVYQFLTEIINVNQLARQMQFWMTDEYIGYIVNNTIPDDIYGESTDVSINKFQFRADTFNPIIGCSIDGINRDLGMVNGQEPIKEANKLFYWMINIISSAYHRENLADQCLVEAPKIKENAITSSAHLSATYDQNISAEKKVAALKIYRFWQDHRGISTKPKKMPISDHTNSV